LDAFGVPGDRRWMLAARDGRFLSQRTHPRLCLVRTGQSGSVAARGSLGFTVTAPGMGTFPLSEAPFSDWIEVQLHADRFMALAGSEEGNRWFAEFLGEPCQLVFMPEEVRRPVDPHRAQGHRVGLADGFPLHLTTEDSLREMNRKLSRKTSMLSYRPNLVVAGGAPWEEDEWRVLEVGGITVTLVKPCARCAVIAVDPGTGVRGQEPLRSLRSFRGWEGKVYFGQNAVFSGTGSFRVGDDVRILERGDRRPPIPG